ncbi:SDR family oxidoreductase [Lichenihabitans psoromatis]|uniref:SDR family oxidoreductase n=1 Tax=Lichenihabitans psoromatis TaxID=2528642 RepID=UPI0010356B75|nr:SDR family oxidoreductase [Lichenihabitans psoromatis]
MAVAVVTGAGAGVGRATAREFARQGFDVGLIARDQQRLDATAKELRDMGVRAHVVTADVADASAIAAAADSIEHELGPIEVWVNNAATSIFSPVEKIEPDEFKRATEVGYLGTVYGSIAALKHMRLRDRGLIINVGSAMGYRAMPLQSAMSGAKFAVRGFTAALRSELFHDRSHIRVSMVHLPSINTPQFDWSLNRLGRKPQPVAPVYQPEVAARAIVFTAQHPRRDVWVGLSTLAAIMMDRFAPGLADRLLALGGYPAQITKQRELGSATANLYGPIGGVYAAHGRFDLNARDTNWEIFTSRHRDTVVVAGLIGLFFALRHSVRSIR